MKIRFGPNMEMNLFCDYKVAIEISQNPVQYGRTKHVEKDNTFHQAKSQGEDYSISFCRVGSLVDKFVTNTVSRNDFYDSHDKLGH